MSFGFSNKTKFGNQRTGHLDDDVAGRSHLKKMLCFDYILLLWSKFVCAYYITKNIQNQFQSQAIEILSTASAVKAFFVFGEWYLMSESDSFL